MKNIINLLPHSSIDGALAPAGFPATLTDSQWTPLTTLGSHIILHRDNTIAHIPPGQSTPITVCTLPQPPIAAIPHGDRLTITTDSRPHLFTLRNDSIIYIGHTGQLPAISFSANIAASFDLAPAPMALSQVYQSGQALTTSDQRAIARALADLAKLYIDYATRAAALTAPIFARARFIDRQGNSLHKTPPVLVGIGPAPIDAPINIYKLDTDAKSLIPLTISLPAWRLQVNIHDNMPPAWAEIIHAIAIDIYNPFTDTSHDISNATVTAAGRNPTYITAATNAANTISQNTPAQSAQRVSLALAGAEGRFIEILRINQPAMSAIAVNATPAMSANTAPLLPDVGVPHSIAAAQYAKSASSVAWINAELRFFDGYDIRHYAAQLVDKPWRAAITVSFADGQSVQWQGEHSTDAPTALSPMLAYPHPDATHMHILLQVDGATTQSLDIDLTPCGHYAAYVDTSLAQTAFATAAAAFSPPQISAAAAQQSLNIAVADIHSPTTALAMFHLCSTPTAIAPATSSGGAWQFARPRFYLFTPTATRLITLSADRALLSDNLIDHRGVDYHQCVTSAVDKVYYLSNARELVELSGTNTRVMARDIHADALGYDPATAAIIAYSSENGIARMYRTDLAMQYFDIQMPQGAWHNIDNRRLIVTDSAIYDAIDLRPVPTRHIQWCNTITPALSNASLQSVTFHIDTTDADINLAIQREHLGRRTTSARYHITGRIAAPITLRPLGRPIHTPHIAIIGNLPPSATLIPPTPTFK